MARFGNWWRLRPALLASLAVLLCSCQTAMVPTNQPLPQNTQGMPIYGGGYALLPMLQRPQGEIVFIMGFSGGGKRSAAFAHGVLRGLRQIPVVEDGRTRSLLDELDFIAAVSDGIPFSFTQPYFDLICSDLGSFPVARAVAASNGFPVLFSPITLISHTENCRGVRPPTASPAEWAQTPDELSRRAELARAADRYLDPERTKYVHLLDGGISDNLALRGVANGGIALDVTADTFRQIALKARRVLVLSVDGQSASDPTLSKQRVVTGLGRIFGAVSGTQIDAYNFETLILTDSELRQLVESLRKVRCTQGRVIEGHDCADVRAELVHISLASIPDAQERQRLQAIPTGLTIPDGDVDLLVSAGESLVQQNSKIRDLISDLDDRAAVARSIRLTKSQVAR